MSLPTLTIDVTGLAEATGEMQRIRSGLADRRQLHASMAVAAAQFTRDYLKSNGSHATAERLGATPTGFRARISKRIESDSNDSAAIIRAPRNTGLGRAFSNITLVPGAGKTYLTIPASRETYGKVVRDFPSDAFKFVIFKGAKPCPALVWAEDGGSHKKGDVAYWLRRKVFQKQDRTLLPSDSAYLEIGRHQTVLYITSLRYRAA